MRDEQRGSMHGQSDDLSVTRGERARGRGAAVGPFPYPHLAGAESGDDLSAAVGEDRGA